MKTIQGSKIEYTLFPICKMRNGKTSKIVACDNGKDYYLFSDGSFKEVK